MRARRWKRAEIKQRCTRFTLIDDHPSQVDDIQRHLKADVAANRAALAAARQTREERSVGQRLEQRIFTTLRRAVSPPKSQIRRQSEARAEALVAAAVAKAAAAAPEAMEA